MRKGTVSASRAEGLARPGATFHGLADWVGGWVVHRPCISKSIHVVPVTSYHLVRAGELVVGAARPARGAWLVAHPPGSKYEGDPNVKTKILSNLAV